jgi:hypothetical protein
MEGERMDTGVERVIERFPEFAASIRARFHDDQSFRDMCSDYAEAGEALQRWQASDDPQKSARVEEYQELAKALEIEIHTALGLSPQATSDDRPHRP